MDTENLILGHTENSTMGHVVGTHQHLSTPTRCLTWFIPKFDENQKMILRCKLLNPMAKLPQIQKSGDAGYDLYYCGEEIRLAPNQRILLDTGIVMEIPEGAYGKISPRSGLAWKCGIDVLGGVIDSGYRGEIKVILLNTGIASVMINRGDAIAQLIIHPCINYLTPMVVTETTTTERGESGFGSTGK
jgi:dUTP pyrophosphatase